MKQYLVIKPLPTDDSIIALGNARFNKKHGIGSIVTVYPFNAKTPCAYVNDRGDRTGKTLLTINELRDCFAELPE
ncbi:MAG: hypothetical protein DRI46_10115 [Chloroflexi bacterium]|nr:MAG: hypothetical protein DRI46_10115 [Chloroflexota bacterium]